MQIIIDKNLYLEPLQNLKLKDVFIFVGSNREEFGRFLEWVPLIQSEDDEKKYLDSLKNNSSNIPFAILYNDKIIGSVGFTCIDALNKSAQMGYCLDKNFQGKGIATKACSKVIEYGFKTLNLQKIIFRVLKENYKSKALLQRLSAEYGGILEKSYCLNNTYMDCEIYNLLRNY